VILLPRFTHDAEQHVKKAIGTLLVIIAIILLARVLTRFSEAAPSARMLQFLNENGTLIWARW
jgi:hypothetical protein